VRFSPRTTVAAFAAVAALSGGALALGGPASADTASDGATPVSTVQVQDTTPAPETTPDTQRDRDCPDKGGQGGTGGAQDGASDGTSQAPDTAPVTTEL
jgi:hypothetical protein